MWSIIKNNRTIIYLVLFFIIISGLIFLFINFDSIVFDRPIDGVIDNLNNKLYVLNKGGFITAIDLENNSPVKKFEVGQDPKKIELNPNTQKLYISNSTDNTVTIINLKKETTKTISVGLKPKMIYVNTMDNKIYVLNTNSDNISVLDGFSDELIATIPVEGRPDDINILKSLNIIYVISSLDKKLTIIDGEENKINSVVSLNFKPTFIFASASGSGLYVGNKTDNTIVLMDIITGQIKKKLDSIGKPNSVFLDKGGENLYTVNNLKNKNNLIIINIEANTNQVFDIEGVISKIRSFGGKIYLLNSTIPKISVINQKTHELIKNIDLPNIYKDIIISRATNMIYLLNSSNEVSVIDADINEVIAVISNEDSFNLFGF